LKPLPTLLCSIVDVEAIGKITKEKDLILVVDNTFASPYLQNPMDLGATIVMHSVTKYIGGHSDVVMGALMLNDEDLYKRFGLFTTPAVQHPGQWIASWYCAVLKHCTCA
jgi:cystathionine gamma-lyase